MESPVDQFAAQQCRPHAIGSLPKRGLVSQQYRYTTVNWVDAFARIAAQHAGLDPAIIRRASQFGPITHPFRLALELVVNHLGLEWPTASRADHSTYSMLPHRPLPLVIKRRTRCLR